MVNKRTGNSEMDNIFINNFRTKAGFFWWCWTHLVWPELFLHQSLFILLYFWGRGQRTGPWKPGWNHADLQGLMCKDRRKLRFFEESRRDRFLSRAPSLPSSLDLSCPGLTDVLTMLQAPSLSLPFVFCLLVCLFVSFFLTSLTLDRIEDGEGTH